MTTTLLTLVVLSATPQEELSLPPAAKLVDEALSAYQEAATESNFITTPLVVEALVNVGRKEDARRLVLDVKRKRLRALLLALYAADVTDRTALPPDIDALIQNEPEHARASIYATVIRALAKQGRPTKAEAIFNRLSDKRGTRVMKVHAAIPLIEAFIAAGDREGARRIVREALKTGIGFALQLATSRQFTPLAAAAVELDETKALSALLDETQIDAVNATDWGNLSAVALSRVGRWRAATRDRDGAVRAFNMATRIAQRIADKTRQQPNIFQIQSVRDEAREAYIAIAANERIAGFPMRADKSLDVFIHLMKQVKPTSVKYKLFDAVKTCLHVGDRSGADRLIARINDPYYRVQAWLKAAEILLDTSMEKKARKRLDEATAEFEQLGDRLSRMDEANRITLLTEMLTMHAQMGDETAATKVGSRAMKLAGDEPGYIQSVARAQVRGGMFEEAYVTLGRIPKGHKYRLLPLLELAAAVTEQEADRDGK